MLSSLEKHNDSGITYCNSEGKDENRPTDKEPKDNPPTFDSNVRDQHDVPWTFFDNY